MPLEAALNYQNEADFTSRFLGPLLRRLGYSIVAEYHGQREFGKDLVFGEIDRFGEVAYHGLQSKYQESVSQSDSEGLIEDCKQAFRHPFRHPTTGAEQRISTFVVANAGSIGDNARENFFTAATNAEHGGAVKMLDGRALLALDRWATARTGENVGAVLSGLMLELRYNWLVLEAQETCMKQAEAAKNFAIERLRTLAVAHYLLAPLLPSLIPTELVSDYLIEADQHLNRRIAMFERPVPKGSVERLVVEVLTSIGVCRKLNTQLESAVQSAQNTLGPLAAA